MVAGRTRIGTSGWSYDHWASGFYPDGLPASRRLEHYSSRFDTVEINATFYQLPTENAVRTWRDTVPEDFAFAVKGSRLITHFQRLGDVDEALAAFMERLGLLGSKLAVVLWQLPPTLHADPDLLGRFLDRLPRDDVRHAVEFRHESWLTEECFGVLRDHGTANVQVSSEAMREDLTATADFVYVRFHGTASYHGDYRRPELEPWAEFLRAQAKAGRDVFAYFNNDAQGHAPKDAARLIDMLGLPAGGRRRQVAAARG